ncbi:hypothetical protein Ancab_040464 [Ancistrocladus abbreviatus]
MAMAQGEQRGEIESSNNQSTGTVDHGREMSIVIPPRLQEIIYVVEDEQPENIYDRHDREEPIGKRKMQKVPEILREVESSKDCYEPLIISVGPFHHGNYKLEQMEKIKISMMQHFIKGTKKRSPEEVYNNFLKAAKNAKTELYGLGPQENWIPDDEFLCILFVDVCFVIQFIIDAAFDHYNCPTRKMMSDGTADVVFRDLFLLENQLPFRVLGALMMLRFPEEEFFEIIERFIEYKFTMRPQRASGHRKWQKRSNIFETLCAGSEPPMHLLHALWMRFTTDPWERTLVSVPGGIDYSYRSAMELKAAGVYFKSRITRSGCLTDIRFDSFSGSLSLGPLVIDDLTKAMFLNLCPFEALHIGPEIREITSYLCVMDSFIQSAEDVKELRSSGVLINRLGSDQDVVNMFDGITDRLKPTCGAHVRVLWAIETQCNSRVRTWIAQFRQQHCSSPLTVLGFVLAAFAIALSVIQTYYQVYPRGT